MSLSVMRHSDLLRRVRTGIAPLGMLLSTGLMLGCSPSVAAVQLSSGEGPLETYSPLARHEPALSVTDEVATLRIVFRSHLVGWIRNYEVEWTRPDGTIYQTERVRKIGHILVVSMPIANEEPSRTPGEWSVSLRDGETPLVALDFFLH